ncbi:MAG: pyrroline-5-carboxylate reductase [Leptospirales bacterium]
MSADHVREECWILGGGRMGQAFLAGYQKQAGCSASTRIVVVDPDPSVRSRLEKNHGVESVPGVSDLPIRSGSPGPSLVFVAVKPTVFPELAIFLKEKSISPLGVSVMAGMPLSRLEEALPAWRWIRTMSNLALTRGEGMTVLAPGKKSGSEELSLVSRIFLEMGRVMMLPERDFDVATALAGSGPGLMALVVEAFADAGIRHGLNRENAIFLAAQMLRGTASLILDEGVDPADLRGRVSSPGGTTIEGICSLEAHAVRGAFIEAVSLMVARSRALSNMSNKGGSDSAR